MLFEDTGALNSHLKEMKLIKKRLRVSELREKESCHGWLTLHLFVPPRRWRQAVFSPSSSSSYSCEVNSRRTFSCLFNWDLLIWSWNNFPADSSQIFSIIPKTFHIWNIKSLNTTTVQILSWKLKVICQRTAVLSLYKCIH